ncbi:MAG: 50S ribosomal protein L11 methyltransferase [Crocinitomicaceae bacterium]|nr:50S ribosomal protein L11 methyltransferase [Crocinitomicaceae bacterium]
MNYIEVEFILEPLLPSREVLVYELGELNYESFVNIPKGIKAYIPIADYDEDCFDSLQALKIPGLNFSYLTKEIVQKNWNELWEKDFDSIVIKDKCIIRAPFHNQPEPGIMDVVISPKMSFGTGHHQTTYMIAAKLFDLQLKDIDVLDMGCGTGVLAIIAKKNGANMVWAVDVEEFAYENTLENCLRNDVSDIYVFRGDATCLTNQRFHLILANINRNILLEDMEAYADVLIEDGLLILSGFYKTDFEVINQKAVDLGLVFVEMLEKEGWAMLLFKK